MPKHTHAVWLITCRCLLMLALTAQAQAGTNKPNIILIFADDISPRELPVYGSDTWSKPGGGDTQDPRLLAQTPVMDRLAEEGMWFKTAWAATVCSPSRAMMMTGRYAHLHKWWHNGDYGSYVTNKPWKGMPAPLYRTSPQLIGNVAQTGGYATYWAGKTQMKGSDLTLFGFDEGCFTPGEQAAPDSPHTKFQLKHIKDADGNKVLINEDTGKPINRKGYAQRSWFWGPYARLLNAPGSEETYTWYPNTPEAKADFGPHTYGPDVEMDLIIDFMQRKQAEDKPFFIYHTQHLGHDGFDYLDPKSGAMWPGTPKITWDEAAQTYTRTEPKVTGSNGVYDTHGTVTEAGIHKHMTYLDYHVWLYLKALEAMDELDNTLLIICSDNGTWGYGKGSEVSQRGCHVPLIVYGPGLDLTKHGEQTALVSMADFVPTIAELGGVTLPENYEMNGQSLVPYLFSEQDQHRDHLYAYKKHMQLVRGHHVLMDGRGTWWDVSESPNDLISFPVIKDWSKVSPAHRAERDRLLKTIKPFDKHETEFHPVP